MSAFLGALRVTLGIDTAEFQEGIKSAQQQMRRIGSQMQAVGRGLSLGLTAPMAAFGASVIHTAGEFEDAMARVGAASSATASEMSAMRELALQLGEDTTKSASESADALEMLAKNGVSASDILGGVAEETVALSEATGGQLVDAADVATNVMTIFRLGAEDMTQAVDGITGVVTNSQFTFDDYALALAQGGAVAAATGVQLGEFNAAIAAISSSFSSGSDAGTSFKSMLMSMVPNSKQAAEVMAQYGINFFDANGAMKSVAETADMLNASLGSLSEQDLMAALKTMFGADGMRAAVALMQAGGAEVRRLDETIQGTSAAQVAADRLGPYARAIEEMGGAFETLRIRIGESGMLGSITSLVNKLSELINWLSQTNPELLKWGTILAGVTAAIGPLLIGLGVMVTAFAAISAPVLAAAAGIAAVAAGVTALYHAVQIVLPYIQQMGPAIWEGIRSGTASALQAVQQFAADLLSTLQALPTQMLQIGKDIMAGLKEGIVSAGSAVVESARNVASNAVSGVKSLLGIHSPSRVMREVGVNVMQGFGDGMDSMSGPVEGSAQSIASSIGSAFSGIIDGTKSVKDAIADMLKTIANAMLNSSLQQLLGGLGGGGKGGGGFLGGLLGGVGKLFGFANGGKFQVGGAGGIDSQLVAFRASPNETVSVTKPGQERSGAGGVADVRVFVDQDGNWQAAVERISDQSAGRAVGGFSRQLDRDIGVRMANARGMNRSGTR